MAIHSSFLAWRIRDRGAWQATVHGVTNIILQEILTSLKPFKTFIRLLYDDSVLSGIRRGINKQTLL